MDNDNAYFELGHPDVGRPDTKGTTKEITAGKKKQLQSDWEICKASGLAKEAAKDFKWFHVKVMQRCVERRAERGMEGFDVHVVMFESTERTTRGQLLYLLSPLAREMRKELACEFSVRLPSCHLPHTQSPRV